MTEACEAVTSFWFDVLKFPVLRVPKAAPNIASRRISEKQGMRLIANEERDYISGRLPTEIWEITAEVWRQHLAERRAMPSIDEVRTERLILSRVNRLDVEDVSSLYGDPEVMARC
jgi:hypothetical protein